MCNWLLTSSLPCVGRIVLTWTSLGSGRHTHNLCTDGTKKGSGPFMHATFIENHWNKTEFVQSYTLSRVYGEGGGDERLGCEKCFSNWRTICVESRTFHPNLRMIYVWIVLMSSWYYAWIVWGFVDTECGLCWCLVDTVCGLCGGLLILCMDCADFYLILCGHCVWIVDCVWIV